MKVLAVIPARGGSKGIPGKNLQLLGGKPLVAWSIEAAVGSHMVDEVVVSTDSKEIAAVANHRARVVMRPHELACDTAPSEWALLHVLECMVDKPDILVFLQCTTPFATSEDIDQAVLTFSRGEYDSLVSVTPSHAHIWCRCLRDTYMGLNHNIRMRYRRQDFPEQYRENGAIYVMNADWFQKVKHRFFGKVGIYVMPPERSLEIDSYFDLQIARLYEGLCAASS